MSSHFPIFFYKKPEIWLFQYILPSFINANSKKEKEQGKSWSALVALLKEAGGTGRPQNSKPWGMNRDHTGCLQTHAFSSSISTRGPLRCGAIALLLYHLIKQCAFWVVDKAEEQVPENYAYTTHPRAEGTGQGRSNRMGNEPQGNNGVLFMMQWDRHFFLQVVSISQRCVLPGHPKF